MFTIFAYMKKVTLLEYATTYNPVRTRRGHKMSASYLYRLIRQDISDELTRPLWFKYMLEGEKDHIFIILD